jgi:NADH:ubiquinone reductase (H+-translocating)
MQDAPETPAANTRRPRVVVIGAGFGGLRAARGLKEVGVEVTLVDSNNFHTFQPLLYQVATAGLDSDDMCFPVRAIVRRHRSVTVRLGAVTAIDLHLRQVTIDEDHLLTYDYLVIAAGSISTSFGIPGVDENTFPLKTLNDALALRTHFLSLVEEVHATVGVEHDLGIVIVGGGPTGVEMAGGMRELLDKVLAKDFPDLHLDRVPITIVEAADRVLGAFHPKLSERAERALKRRGILVEVGVGVASVEPHAVVLKDGRRLTGQTLVWAAGVTANPVSQLLGIELSRGGRIPVEPDLSVVGFPEVFAIGDIANALAADSKPLPQVAQPAIQGGVHVAKLIAARIAGRPSTPFTYHDKGSMATIGRNQAVAELPNGWLLSGIIGWGAWLGLHIVYLMGFRNRANVLVNWAWNYLTYDRGSRLIIGTRTNDDRPPDHSARLLD